MSKTIEIGPYSAYAIAVKYGYVGTEEDWIKAVEAARKSAETSAANAKREADGASTSAATATEQAGIATTKAGESAASAEASASSASAAATSEANAKKYSEEAGAKANTDKTLSIENAPADAKATGDALDKKANKDVILDEDGNVIFYSKAAVDKLLAGKLNLTGGTMAGELCFSGDRNGSILSGDEDAANVPGGPLNNLVIRSWWGVSFTTNCPDQTYTGKTAVGIDCRNGTIKAPRFEGVADNGVVASGDGYVRFGDGTQICWGRVAPANAITSTEKYVSFPLPFAENGKVLSCSNANMGGPIVQVGWETTIGFTIGAINGTGGETSWLAIGRWK